MNKAELNALLAVYPDDIEIVVAGFEAGMEPVVAIRSVAVEDIAATDTAYPAYNGRYLPSQTGKQVVLLASSDQRWNCLSAEQYRSMSANGNKFA